jgi:hypothetical protein
MPRKRAREPEPEPDYKRLGQYVLSRRVQLGYTTRLEFAEATRLGVRTIYRLEHGVLRADDVTYARVQAVLGWGTGSCEAISRGGEPTPAPAPADAPELRDETLRAIWQLPGLTESDKRMMVEFVRYLRDRDT